MRQEQTGSQNIAMIPLHFSFFVSFFALSFGFAFARQFLISHVNVALFSLDSPTILISLPISVAGIAIGIFLGSWLTLQSGRKILIQSSSIFGMGAFLASCVAPNLSVYITSYFVLGLTLGLYLLAALMYIAEIALPIQRGIALSYIPTMFMAGIFLALPLQYFNEISELLPFLVAYVILNLIFLLLFYIKVPESPRWLSLVGLSDSSLNVLFKLRLNMGLAAHELAVINDSVRHNIRGATLFFQNNNFRQVMWFYSLFAILLHLSGVSFFPIILSLYMTNALEYDQVFSCNLKECIFYAMIFAMVLAALINTLFIERVGRRKLLLISATSNCIMLFLIWVFFLTIGHNNNYLTLMVLSIVYVFTATLSACVFLSCFVDIAPTCARDFCVSAILFIFVTSILLMIRVLFDYHLYLSFSNLVLIFSIFAFIFVIVIKKFFPDTNDLSLEEIESHIFDGRKVRLIGNNIKDNY